MYSDYVEAQRGRKRPRTLIQGQRQWEDFQVVMGLSAEQVTAADLQLYLERHIARGVKVATAWGYLSRLLPFFRWLFRKGYLLADPGQDIKIPMFARQCVRPLTPQEVMELLSLPPRTLLERRNQAILEVFYGTGLRLGEVQAMTLSDLFVDQLYCKIPVTKGGEPRLAPLPPYLVAVLRQYLKEVRPQLARSAQEDGLWLTASGLRCTAEDLGKLTRKAGLRAGLALTPHRLRHAFATHLCEAGASLRHVQVLLGHSTLQATQIYTHLSAAELLKEYRRTHPRAQRAKPL